MARLPDSVYRLVGRYSFSAFNRWLHVPLYRLTSGRWFFGRALGAQMVVLTTVGGRTGRDRSSALFAFADGSAWVVVASRGGSARLPGWYRNLQAGPQARLQVGRRRVAVRARDADGEEYERLWGIVNRAYPGFGVYQGRSDYRIPVVILEPVES